MHRPGDRARETALARALLALLDGGQDLRGAACRGAAPRFDDVVDGEDGAQRSARLRAAEALCARCPVLARCAATAAALPRGSGGVWAGRVVIDVERVRQQRATRERRARSPSVGEAVVTESDRNESDAG